MKQLRVVMLSTTLTLLLCSLASQAQQSVATATNAIVPPLVNFSGVLSDGNGKALTGMVGVTFYLYQDQQGGSPLWLETQNVQPDKAGHYTVLLGSTTSTGLPGSIFASGEAHWLGVQVQGQEEQPRVLLVSAPYALKAGDAETVGGLPPSAFVLAGPINGSGGILTAAGAGSPVSPSAPFAGMANYIPVWTGPKNAGDSIMYQASGNSIGVGTTTPAATLDVNGGVISRGALQLPSTGTANASQGYNSQPFSLQGSSFNSSTGTAIGPLFQWQTEPSGNNTSNPAGTLNLLYGSGSGSPTETGLNIASNGKITFASGQTFPGTGTVTSVGSGAGLTGGPITGSGTLSIATGGVSNAMLANPSLTVAAGTDLTGGGTVALGGTTTLNVDTTKIPQLAAANTFTGNQTVNGNLTATGVVSGGSYQIGSNLFAFGSYANGNAFLGFAGNINSNNTGQGNTGTGDFGLSSNTTGFGNTASGYAALSDNTTGNNNTATGFEALVINTTGSNNTASGFNSLYNNTTGSYNTVNGYAALMFNATGSFNTAIGNQALYQSTGRANTGIGNTAGVTADSSSLTGNNNTALGTGAAFSTGTLTNATAIGANAEVAESNAMVLGSINGVNGQTANTSVGIGTTTPHAKLDVAGNSVETLIGDPACGSGFAGLGFVVSGGFNSCKNYALIGDSPGNLYVNSSLSGTIYFRNKNADLMTIDTSGDVHIKGNLSKGSGSFQIDHPLDPANKYLYHSFVESPDMMNVYNGLARLDARGAVWITLPTYFEALNRDFRYQLTSIGRPQPSLYIAREISGNRFRISGGKPGGKVSWQVTGIRHDAYADAHRIEVEVEKPPQEQGHYLHPELFGAPPEEAVGSNMLGQTESAPVSSLQALPLTK